MILSAKVLSITSFLVKILFLTMIFSNDVNGSINKEDGTTILPESDLKNQTQNLNESNQSMNNDSEVIDPDYPYEEILQIVKETKKLLSSANDTEKREKLKFDPVFYGTYLHANIVDAVSYDSGIDLGGSQCREEFQWRRPRKLTGEDGKLYYVLNVGKDFIQTTSFMLCVKPGEQCGYPHLWPENYVYNCEQAYRLSRQFSIPVDKIDISEQEIRSLTVPHSCNCIPRPFYGN